MSVHRRVHTWLVSGGATQGGASKEYMDSYLLIRTVVGVIGILLPFALYVAQGVLHGPWRLRGSISEYAHSSAHDVFVGSLTVIGILLITYMAGRWDADFWVSSVAGAALLGVAFVATDRPGHPVHSCKDVPSPASCTPVERVLGEATAAHIHYACAAVALGMLAVIAYVFAVHERRTGGPARLHLCCAGAIVAGLGLAVLGGLYDFTVLGLAPLYLGEVVTVWAFGLGWLVKGYDLWRRLGRFVPRLRPPAAPDPAG